MSAVSRIVLADDQVLVRAGIRALLESLPGCAVIDECADGLLAIDSVRNNQPDILVLDIAMPGPSGIEVAREIRGFDNNVRILILSSIDRAEIVEQAMAAGADGYLLKDFLLAELQQAITSTRAGDCYLSPRLAAAMHPGNGGLRFSGALTPRQAEVLRRVASGMTTKEIARELGISPKTVEFHRSQLMEKLGVRDVTGLTRYAVQNGVL